VFSAESRNSLFLTDGQMSYKNPQHFPNIHLVETKLSDRPFRPLAAVPKIKNLSVNNSHCKGLEKYIK
jgi:hypothetical protein